MAAPGDTQPIMADEDSSDEEHVSSVVVGSPSRAGKKRPGRPSRAAQAGAEDAPDELLEEEDVDPKRRKTVTTSGAGGEDGEAEDGEADDADEDFVALDDDLAGTGILEETAQEQAALDAQPEAIDDDADDVMKRLRRAGRSSGKPTKQQKADEEAQRIASCWELLSDMYDAAISDRKAAIDRVLHADRSKHAAGLKKLSMLPRVRRMVATKDLLEPLLDGVKDPLPQPDRPTELKLLDVLREWLRPPVGAHLPNLQIRTAVYEMVARIPDDHDSFDAALRHSRIGHVFGVVVRHREETAGNRRLLKATLDRWRRRFVEGKAADPRESIQAVRRREVAAAAELGVDLRRAASLEQSMPEPAKRREIVAATRGDLAAALNAGGVGTFGSTTRTYAARRQHAATLAGGQSSSRAGAGGGAAAGGPAPAAGRKAAADGKKSFKSMFAKIRRGMRKGSGGKGGKKMSVEGR